MKRRFSVTAGTKEFTLDNGLTVLLKEDRSAPLVTCQLWFAAGAADEPEGLWGAAHLIEHLLFRSTRDFPDGELTRRLRLAGGAENAATGHDYTYYWTALPSESLELALAGMGGRFFPLFREDELKKELGIVLSEMEGEEDDPAGSLYRLMLRKAYSVSPYGRPVIGRREDLESMTPEGLRSFFDRYYTPSNAALVLVGDTDEARALGLAEKYFGGVAAAPRPERRRVAEPVQKGRTDCVLYWDPECHMVEMGYHIPDMNHPDAEPLSILGYILGYGMTGRLYRSLVDAGPATDVWASPETRLMPSLFNVGAEGKPGTPPEALTEALLREAEAVKRGSVTPEEIEKAILRTGADIIYDNASFVGLGETLGFAQVTGGWRRFDSSFDKLYSVTPEDVTRVAKTYLDETNLTVARSGSGAGSFVSVPAPRLLPEPEAPAAEPPAAAPDTRPARRALDNGMTVIAMQRSSSPSIALTGHFTGGSAGDKYAAALMAQLLLRGSENYSARETAGMLEDAGAELEFARSSELIKVSGKCLAGDAPLLLSALSEAVRRPVFPGEELEKVRKEALAELGYNRALPGYMAANRFYHLAVPPGDPRYACLPDEAEERIRACGRADVERVRQRLLRPDSFTLVLCGDIEPEEAFRLAEKYFGDWRKPGFPREPLPSVEGRRRCPFTRISLPMEGRSEVRVVFGYPVDISKLHPDYAALSIADHILGGGSIGSRLGSLIREESGLAYGIGSAFSGYLLDNVWTCSFGTHPDKLEEALDKLLGAIDLFRREGAAEEEVVSAVNHITGREKRLLSVNAGMCAALETGELRGLGADFPWKIAEYYSAATPEKVSEMAARYFTAAEGLLVCAGALK
ncbi:MAG: insulinase family protein [Abditibacteriota bacterium]|nr:insulinase family protein [Abditibacteriota bacterium]